MFIKTICSILTVLIINAILVVGCDEPSSNENEHIQRLLHHPQLDNGLLQELEPISESEQITS
jgi:uncharacterized protein YcfL